jgi:hypothetical protein
MLKIDFRIKSYDPFKFLGLLPPFPCGAHMAPHHSYHRRGLMFQDMSTLQCGIPRLMNGDHVTQLVMVVGTRADPGLNASTKHQQNPNYRPCYRSVCSLGYRLEDKGQTGITGTYPTQCHHNGEVLSI